jgi:hypothetical protein
LLQLTYFCFLRVIHLFFLIKGTNFLPVMVKVQEYYVCFIVVSLKSFQPAIYREGKKCALLRMREVKYMNKYSVVPKCKLFTRFSKS